MRRILALCVALAGCGDTLQYVPPPVTSQERVGVSARTVMIEDVSVPEYASVQEIAVQQPDGSIIADADNVWADLPDRALAASLLRNLNAITSAKVAPAPWPLSGFPDAELSVFVEDMYAGADGRVRLSGIYAIASETGRDRLGRFDLSAPITVPGFVGITAAHEVVWAELALKIAGDL
ncbi:membrane integrity-associated transporter subunit PqiC [Jannaschia sp. Os4]|uniref:PqiC family protein n=1 Tax=Jannaschia sp. Os4 TaxID=2807617 RepID=UPI00193AAED3|nr:PqiC family protein [Jannaschia sp. Os4]MBM2574902.1 membrane integrity-associated transporter subunit PqiC [Jannaschia sp. Os4]